MRQHANKQTTKQQGKTSMEQGQGSGSKTYHHVCSEPDKQGVNHKGHGIESLEDDFKSLLIGNAEKPRHSDVELRSDEVETHSDVEISSSEEQGWCKITRNSDLGSATSENKSLNVNIVDGTDVPAEDTMMIRCGSEIIPGPVSDGHLSYKFKIKPMNESPKKVFKVSLDWEHVKCSICLNIWRDVVTVSPCLHNFCNGCFSEWSRRSQEKHSIVLCPHCSSDVQSVGRNHFLHRIEKKICKRESSARCSDEELSVVNSYALMKSLPIKYRKKPRSKRARLMRDEYNYGTDLSCAQCGTEYGGFQGNKNTLHLQCHSCGGMMPMQTNIVVPPNIVVPQHCVGCDRAFCGAFWHSQQVTRNDSYAMCAPETFKPIGERTITRIPYHAHGWNQHEQDITERCIQQMEITLQDVVSEWVTKLNGQEIDLTRMPLNHAEMITSGTHICNDCFEELVSFLLYWFRVSLPKDHLPEDAAQREDCWYGYDCRTQNHNDNHARTRNHVCPPTIGAIRN